MKKMLAAVTLAAAVLATVALARPAPVTDAEVQAAIDARLHELLVRLNSQHR
jgi:hypothetical protein